VKELLKSDNICKSYAQMKKGAVFLTHSVVRFCKDCNIQYLFANIQYKVITEFVHETRVLNIC